MLTTVERILFVALVLVIGALSVAGFAGIVRIIRSGRTAPPLKDLPRRLAIAFLDVGLQRPIFRARPVLSTFHAFVFFGFSYYLLVNFTDILEGFIPGFELVYGGASFFGRPLALVDLYNLVADLLSVLVLVGMIALLVRRFLTDDRRLHFNESVLLHPKVTAGGVRRDSFIVGLFILFHIGSRFMGQAFRLAETGQADAFMPFASLAALPFRGLSEGALTVAIHATWWLALGLIIVFMPYLFRSKHIHLLLAPVNLGLARQAPRGRLDPAVPAGSPIELEPGAATLHDLAWPRLLDGYACIMCNRCHDVCPAHNQGLSLSPAALEINKRYLLNDNFLDLARGGTATALLTDRVITPEAVWSCTTCYACVRVCPVGNEPMADIIDIRRRLIVSGEEIDSGIQGALESLAKNGNWLGKGSRGRSRWTKGLEFEVKDATKAPVEYLWFVGDTAAFDDRVVPQTQRLARILHEAGVDFGILGRLEKNAGNDVRRVGEEGLFEQLVEENLAAFGASQFRQILTTDPHSLNALRNEYPQYGGMWPVHHYSNLLLELVDTGRITLQQNLSHYRATYHDPCYLGRYNGGYAAPRQLLARLGVALTEMPRNRENSFCCGAGGGQIWLSQTPDGERPAENRIREALAALSAALRPSANGASANGSGPADKFLFIVACPKDVIMYADAVKTTGSEELIEVRDIVELVEEAMGERARLTIED